MRKLVTDITTMLETMDHPENDPVYLKSLFADMPKGKRHKHPLYHKYLRVMRTESTGDNSTITITVPMFIRALEWAHEDAKTDVEIHKFVENIIARGGTLNTDDYEDMLPKD